MNDLPSSALFAVLRPVVWWVLKDGKVVFKEMLLPVTILRRRGNSSGGEAEGVRSDSPL